MKAQPKPVAAVLALIRFFGGKYDREKELENNRTREDYSVSFTGDDAAERILEDLNANLTDKEWAAREKERIAALKTLRELNASARRSPESW